MREGGDDETCIGQGHGGVEMPGIGAPVTMGYHHQRQAVTRECRIAGNHLLIGLNRLQLRRSAGGIPNADLDGWPLWIADAEMLEADRGVGLAGGGDSDECDENLCDDAAHGTSCGLG